MTQKQLVPISGKTYSIMNADTGREIRYRGTTEFVFEQVDDAHWYIKENDRYLQLIGGISVSDTPVVYRVLSGPFQRYQIVVDEAVLCDTDEGTTDEIILGTKPLKNQDIDTGWYLTEAGNPKPLKILPLGDSITFGINIDTVDPRYGWRDDLTLLLSEHWERFVFVGAQLTTVTTLQDRILTRHEGHPGWTIQDMPGPNRDYEGIYKLVDGVMSKYTPDVVLLMIGINDLYCWGGTDGLTEEGLNEHIRRYKLLVNKVGEGIKNKENATIFCSTLTPVGSVHPTCYGVEKRFNDRLPQIVKELQVTLPVCFHDNHAAFDGTTDGVSSDGLHLSLQGDTYVAGAYAKSLLRVYDAQGCKKE